MADRQTKMVTGAVPSGIYRSDYLYQLVFQALIIVYNNISETTKPASSKPALFLLTSGFIKVQNLILHQ